jgi:hypothetical protein
MDKSTGLEQVVRRYDLIGYVAIGLVLLGFLYLFNFTTFFGPLGR